jgi:hypothetical protein
LFITSIPWKSFRSVELGTSARKGVFEDSGLSAELFSLERVGSGDGGVGEDIGGEYPAWTLEKQVEVIFVQESFSTYHPTSAFP